MSENKDNYVQLEIPTHALSMFVEDVNNFYLFLTELDDFVGNPTQLKRIINSKFGSIGSFSATLLLALEHKRNSDDMIKRRREISG